jgi:AbrB family looped-hinge helix DNA binding protein
MGLFQYVQPLAKGQITIPVKMRKKLGIGEDTLLKVELRDERLVLTPLKVDREEKYIRSFSDTQIRYFLALDKLDKKTYQKAKKLLTGK